MTGRERFARILAHKPVDRVGLYEQFWRNTEEKWRREGKIQSLEDVANRFSFDIAPTGGFNCDADPAFVPVVIREDEETIVRKDGNGAILRTLKYRDGAPEHIGFTITCRREWEEQVRPLLTRRPFPAERLAREYYLACRAAASISGRALVFYTGNVFSCLTAICGHETILAGMVEDPDWIRDMVEVYTNLLEDLQEELFSACGWPDAMWYTDDLGYKLSPFLSPAMFREFLLPGYRRTIAHAHAHHTPVVLHSCGFMEPLLPDLLSAGLDCLQAMEVKAGMDCLRIHRLYGDRLALIGGLDARVLESNDRARIDRELEEKIPLLKQGYGYVMHSDHSVSNLVEYDTFAYFVERGMSLGKYTGEG